MKRQEVVEVVNSKITMEKITCVRSTIVVRGYGDDGKTTLLKEVIKQLYQLFPDSFRSRKSYDPSQFDLTKVSAAVKAGDRWAIFEIKGIKILIFTGGDNAGVIRDTFARAVKVNAQIVVSALKISEEGTGQSRAQQAYELIRTRASFETIFVDIRGKKLRSVHATKKVAEKVLQTLLQQITTYSRV